VGDFGTSHELICGASGKVGTPLYSAPEILAQKPHHWPVDVWSYGCILCCIHHRTPQWIERVRRCTRFDPEGRPHAAALLALISGPSVLALARAADLSCAGLGRSAANEMSCGYVSCANSVVHLNHLGRRDAMRCVHLSLHLCLLGIEFVATICGKGVASSLERTLVQCRWQQQQGQQLLILRLLVWQPQGVLWLLPVLLQLPSLAPRPGCNAPQRVG
ncbi:MAG: hypothetical protein SGPRY_013270, partial [Prymnesium sp.]